jgi:hypothetical protein
MCTHDIGRSERLQSLFLKVAVTSSASLRLHHAVNKSPVSNAKNRIVTANMGIAWESISLANQRTIQEKAFGILFTFYRILDQSSKRWQQRVLQNRHPKTTG